MKQGVLIVLFQSSWLACVLGGAHGWIWLGPLWVSLFVLVMFWMLSLPLVVLWNLILLALIGSSVDGLLTRTGVFIFPEPVTVWAPPYLMALWLAFVANFEGPLSWLKGRYLLAASLGALAGPVNYLAGARLGAIQFGTPLPTTLVILTLEWAILMPLLLFLHHRLSTNGRQPAYRF
jgi:Protein of unknown function (DUF2878)